MSKEELKRFRQDLRANPELKNKLRQARKQALREASVAFASSAGYTITLDDYKTKKGKGKRKSADAAAS